MTCCVKDELKALQHYLPVNIKTYKIIIKNNCVAVGLYNNKKTNGIIKTINQEIKKVCLKCI